MPPVADSPGDWFEVVENLAGGDATAFFRVSQLVTGVLRGMRAYDIESDWSDVIQEVAIGTVDAVRAGRLRSSDNVVGFVRQIARHKISDRHRRQGRTQEDKTTPIEETSQSALADPRNLEPGEILDLRRALERLPEAQRKLVVAVYGERKTYEEASKELGIPLGTAKRQLQRGMERLRARFSERDLT